MQGSDTPIVQDLCAQIAEEENPGKVKQLVRSLQSAVDAERDETRLRLRLIARQYRSQMQSSPTGSKLVNVMNFLGLSRHHGTRGANSQPGPDKIRQNK